MKTKNQTESLKFRKEDGSPSNPYNNVLTSKQHRIWTRRNKVKIALVACALAVGIGSGIGAGYGIWYNKSFIYEKDFYSVDEFNKFANEPYIIKDDKTFNDGYESALWFDNNMKADWIAHISAWNAREFCPPEVDLANINHIWINISKVKIAGWSELAWSVNFGLYGILKEGKQPIDANISTIMGIKMYYLHNSSETPDPTDNPAKSGIWFNVTPLLFNGDYSAIASAGTVAAITIEDDSKTVEYVSVNSDDLALKIPKAWIPNIYFNYQNNPEI